MYPVTAQDEILRRIKALDGEEADLRREAGHLLAGAARAEAKAESVAVLRRQFEFAFTQLGGEFPRATEVPVPVRKSSGRLIASLG